MNFPDIPKIPFTFWYHPDKGMIFQNLMLIQLKISEFIKTSHINSPVPINLKAPDDGLVWQLVKAPVASIEFEQAIVVGKIHHSIRALTDHPCLPACLVIRPIVVLYQWRTDVVQYPTSVKRLHQQE